MMVFIAVSLVACDDNDETITPAKEQADRTVIVYMSAENNLSIHAFNNLMKMKEGTASLHNGNLLVYFDRAHENELPWLARIKDNRITDSVTVADMGIANADDYASNPHVFEDVLRYAISHYPAKRDYALVLWGHATGWILEDSIPYTRGYGFDNGHNDRTTKTGYWLNIPTMARILDKMSVHWSYIFADCCNFMCLESLYELRNTCDYIAGSPSEVPGAGAPYKDIVADMFLPDAEQACRNIVGKYYEAQHEALPLSIVRTKDLEQLATATRNALEAVRDNVGSMPDMDGVIHYMNADPSNTLNFNPAYNIFYDAGHFFLKHAPQSEYETWKQALGRAVIDSRISTRWLTEKAWNIFYSDFTITSDNYHGVSMFVPQDPALGYYAKYNEDIKRFSWYKAVALNTIE